MKKYTIIFFAILLSCTEQKKSELGFSDDDGGEHSKKEKIYLDPESRKKLIESYDEYDKINYELIVIKNRKQLTEILEEYGNSKDNSLNNHVFITLNRKETKFLRIGDTCVIPDKIVEDNLAYSCFPYFYPEAVDIDKLIMVSNYYQAYGCYENGKLVRYAACNTGKERTPTYPGRYALVWKELKRHSSLDTHWVMPFTFNFHRYAGNAFHQYEMPGFPVSHSCIRQSMTDAKWLYYWGKGVKIENGEQVWLSGTPVVIFGVPDYSARKSGPWQLLKNNKERPFILDYDPMEVEEAFIPISQIPESVRNWIPNRKRYKAAEDTLRARGIIAGHIKLTASVDFNKLRREKRYAILKKMKADSLKKKLELNANPQTNIEEIKNNLKELEPKDSIKK